MTTLQWIRFLVVVLWVNLELTESKMMVRHFGPPPDMGPGPHGKYDWVIKVMQSTPNRCPNARTECALTCENGGTLDNGTCQCECDQKWGGNSCSQCALSCKNGVLNEQTCKCKCRGGWSGNLCADCEIECDSTHFLNGRYCQCRLCSNNQRCSDNQPVDCQALVEAGNHISGVYTVYPAFSPNGLKVYCTMEYIIHYDGTIWRSWTVIQRRDDGSENFTRSWNEYKDGFGSMMGNFWLGNDVLHNLTREGEWALLVALKNTDGTGSSLIVKPFSIMSSNNNYALITETASLTYYSDIGKQPLLSAAGQQFSTYDRDNDKDPESNCAGLLQGGWWFNRCTGGNPPSDTPVGSNLNGEYSHPVNYSSQDYRGIRWNTWDEHQIVKSEMKIMRCTGVILWIGGALFC